ncbi:MAG: beta-L-arabinofuranosidase domain-containing protein, partial [Limisphaerales bacterium]
DVQALAELWRITGETSCRDAFTSHWRTIREFDRRNTGAFSGGEKATGNAFAPTKIETCCTVAWMALSCDMLRLTGDPQVADELELSTFNAALGAQHPSGRWWTYNTPMDGVRKASAHDIVFQARAGSPELNCCSVNGPRTLGMLSDWAVMRDDRGFTVNWLGPLEWSNNDGSGAAVSLRCETTYPLDGRIIWHITSDKPVRLRFRIPAWAEGAGTRIAGTAVTLKPGTYLEAARTWRDADTVELLLPLKLRTFEGQQEQKGKISIYRGPLLLTYDQRDNAFDEAGIPPVEPARFSEAKLIPSSARSENLKAPWLLLEVPTTNGPLRLSDFASAGASGTRYRSWLPVAHTEASRK